MVAHSVTRRHSLRRQRATRASAGTEPRCEAWRARTPSGVTKRVARPTKCQRAGTNLTLFR